MRSSNWTRRLMVVLAGALTAANVARAAHSAAYLDAFAAEVSARQETPDLSTTQQRALTSASKTLERDSKTAAADIGLLSKAGRSLDAAFPEDATFSALQSEALDNYVADAQTQLNSINERIGDVTAPTALSNQLSAAQAALDSANDSNASISTRARSATLAINRIRAADRQASRLVRAPLNLEGGTVTIVGRNNFGVTLDSNGTYTIPGDPEETGTWTYERTGSRTGIITASPSGGGSHTLNLTFSNSGRGSFSGTTAADESVNGTFSVATQ